MKLPSKLINYNLSTLKKLEIILNKLTTEACSPNELYKGIKKQFSNIGEFLESLDILFILDKIKLNLNGEIILC